VEVTFSDSTLDEFEVSLHPKGRFPQGIQRTYIKLLTFIRSAKDERDLHSNPGYRFKKLKGNRKHQCAFRLNDQYRLIVELQQTDTDTVVHIVDIEDYHK